MTATHILAIIGGILFLLSLIPQLDARLAAIGGICLAIALYLR